MWIWLAWACSAEPEPGRLVRLTHLQWERSVVDLLGLPTSTGSSASFVPDTAVSTFENDAAGLFESPTLWQQHQAAAEAMGQLVAHDRSLRRQIQPHRPLDEGEVAAWIRGLGRRVWRRPLTVEEVSRLSALYLAASGAYRGGDPDADGVRATVVAMLQAPAFLYRTEGLAADSVAGELSGDELAARLAFALWNSTPDEALLDAAEGGLTPEEHREQVARLLAHPKARETVGDLHRQLLHVDSYENIERGFEPYEDYSKTLSGVMQAEVYAFVDRVVFSGGNLAQLLTSNETFADAQLAEIYEVEGPTGVGVAEMVPVTLDPGERAGLLTMAGFLKYHASGDEANLITRGAFVNTALLCADLPPAPPGVPPLPASDRRQTQRERIEEHTAACGGACHNELINPIGFSLGYYDGSGHYRTSTAGPKVEAGGGQATSIDASGTYTFDEGPVAFEDAVDLAWQMAEQPQVHRCYVRQLLQFYEGRALTAADAPRIEALAAESLDGAPILDLIASIASSPELRRPPRR